MLRSSFAVDRTFTDQVLQWEGLELRVLLTKGGAVRWFQVRRPEALATDTAESTPS